MNACHEFRSRLASLLSGRATSASLGALSWHEHLVSCEACRGLVAAEEALEELLASLPEPHLPPALAQRLLARLEPARAEAELDSLLDRSSVGPVPEGLVRNVLANLAGARRAAIEERELDHLLELLPEPEAPADLARRVLARAALERRRLEPTRVAWTPRLRRVLVAASILVVAGAATWFVIEGRKPATPVEVGLQDPSAPHGTNDEAVSNDDPPEELLAQLDLLESWDILVDDSVEADVNALGPVDELLLGLDADEERAR